MALAVYTFVLLLACCALGLPASEGNLINQASSWFNVQPNPSLSSCHSWTTTGSVSLHGQGSHRQLHCNLNVNNLQHLACASVKVFLLQPLRPEVFADPYELASIERKSGTGGPRFKVFGHIDLEQPAYLCDDTLLALDFPPTQLPGHSLHLNVSVPIHAKYMQPIRLEAPSWKTWHQAGWHSVQLHEPFIWIQCQDHADSTMQPHLDSNSKQSIKANSHADSTSDLGLRSDPELDPQPNSLSIASSESSSNLDLDLVVVSSLVADSKPGPDLGAAGAAKDGGCGWGYMKLNVSLEGPMPTWHIPAGNSVHEHVVQVGTGLATALCCVAIAWAAWRHSRDLVC